MSAASFQQLQMAPRVCFNPRRPCSIITHWIPKHVTVPPSLADSLPISTNVSPALLAAADVFERCGITRDTDTFVLGGGTTLASRWHHRLSTDLDFFMGFMEFRQAMFLGDSPGNRVLAEMADQHRISDLRLAAAHCAFQVGQTPVTLFTTQAFSSAHPTQRESQTGICLESTTEILAKKLIARILKNGDFAKRDFYDFCVASIEDPQSWRAVTSLVAHDDVSAIIQEIRNPGTSPLVHMAETGSDILEPKYANIASNLWKASVGLLSEGGIPEWIHPPARAHRTPPDDHGLGR